MFTVGGWFAFSAAAFAITSSFRFVENGSTACTIHGASSAIASTKNRVGSRSW